jgi:hypothetical protein
MTKIFVFGCSVSDYCLVDKNYSDYLIDEGYEVSKNTQGGGSNYASFRKLHKRLREGEIDSNSRVVFQYTNPIRREIPIGEDITHWKFGSYAWNESKEIHKMWEDNCVNEEYELEVFLNQCYITELALISLNIPTLWITSSYIAPLHTDLLPLAKHKLFTNHLISFVDKRASEDGCHFSDYGHREMAQIIKNWEINL